MWGALATVAGGALGGLFGSQGSQQTATNEPWKAQQPYLKDLFGQAQNAYNSGMQTGPYTGGLYAGMDPMTAQGVAGTGQFAQGPAMDTATGALAAGNPAMSQGTQGLTGVAGQLSNLQDPTQQNIANAGAYADNPYLSGQIDAASRDVTRNLTEDVLPGISRGASLSGGANSSRTGIAEGVALRGAQDRIGDIASSMRGQAYDRGLGLSESARGTNIAGSIAGGGLYDSLAGRGFQGAQTGSTLGFNALDAMVRAGQITQADAQGLLNEQKGQYDLAANHQFDLLDQYKGIIGGDYGGTKTAQTGVGGFQGAMQGAIGGAASGLGLYNSFKKADQIPTPDFGGLY